MTWSHVHTEQGHWIGEQYDSSCCRDTRLSCSTGKLLAGFSLCCPAVTSVIFYTSALHGPQLTNTGFLLARSEPTPAPVHLSLMTPYCLRVSNTNAGQHPLHAIIPPAQAVPSTFSCWPMPSVSALPKEH